MKFGCLQKYYDNGRVEVVVLPVDDDTQNYLVEKPEYDEWLDVFDTKQEADAFKLSALEA